MNLHLEIDQEHHVKTSNTTIRKELYDAEIHYKRLDWAWIAQTVYYTLLFRANGRSSKVLTEQFGDSLERMTAVTDRHSAYFALHFHNHQVCLAHLLRE